MITGVVSVQKLDVACVSFLENMPVFGLTSIVDWMLYHLLESVFQRFGVPI